MGYVYDTISFQERGFSTHIMVRFQCFRIPGRKIHEHLKEKKPRFTGLLVYWFTGRAGASPVFWSPGDGATDAVVSGGVVFPGMRTTSDVIWWGFVRSYGNYGSNWVLFSWFPIGHTRD